MIIAPAVGGSAVVWLAPQWVVVPLQWVAVLWSLLNFVFKVTKKFWLDINYISVPMQINVTYQPTPWHKQAIVMIPRLPTISPPHGTSKLL